MYDKIFGLRREILIKNRYIWGIYSIIVCLGAFLMFLIQPLIGKVITPQYGGVAQVWCLCILFFQTALLGGYLLSYFLSNLSYRVQGIVYALLIVFSLLFINVSAATWAPGDVEIPVVSLLAQLIIYLAIPVIVLSTVSTTFQNWYRIVTGKNPYHLYGISNIGALAALIAYPVLIEPNISVSLTLKLWTWGYWLLVIFACIVVVIMVLQTNSLQKSNESSNDNEKVANAPSLIDYVFWTFLSASGSILLISFTNQMTHDIAPVPFLWTIPLAVYLLSFVLCFSHEKIYNRSFFAFGSLFLLLIFFVLKAYPVLLRQLLDKSSMPVFLMIISNLIMLFSLLMICHGEIYKRKPDSKYLPVFYLFIAYGGVLGGILVNIVAPFVFNNYLEFELMLLVMSFFIIFLIFKNQLSLFNSRKAAKVYTVLLVCIILAGFYDSRTIRVDDFSSVKLDKDVELLAERNFYGAVKVGLAQKGDHIVLYLLNGTIVHGAQMINPITKHFINKPLLYYSEDSVFAIANKAMRIYRGNTPLKIADIGLGAGIISYYGRDQDEITFFEIDPKIIKIATKNFNFLRSSKAKIKIITGDGRLSLQKLPPQDYDILFIDAFNGDAIPTHLLTREAMKIYLSHIKDDGLIVFHLSNAYLNLKPVISNVAMDLGLNSISFKTHNVYLVDYCVVYKGDWFWNTIKQPVFRKEFPSTVYSKGKWNSDIGVWTDDYSNLISAIKMKKQ
ncbi:MAG: hypothetical protein ACD_20C00097G0034 [uncultured bacterium]|nr:MAG: hypothetical protein ACD_20C00097G0034 [uncultured bacterium]HBH18040.1 hypothetical protein [Cyanobacteria bacterium UBA9579]